MKNDLFICFASVPDEAGGPAEAGERPARQSLRAAGRVGPRAGAEQPPAGSGQTHGAAQAAEVRRQLGLRLLQQHRLKLKPPSPPQPDGDGGAAAGAGGGAAAAAGGAQAESSWLAARTPVGPSGAERVLPAGAPEVPQVGEPHPTLAWLSRPGR